METKYFAKGKLIKENKENKENEHYKDWVFFSSKEKKYWKKRFKKFWRIKGVFSPLLFDGDSSKVEEFILKKYPDQPTNTINQMEVAVKNPPPCICCKPLNGEPSAYVTIRNWNRAVHISQMTNDEFEDEKQQFQKNKTRYDI